MDLFGGKTIMTTVDPIIESRPGWFWRAYNILERIVVGAVWGWSLTIPLLMLTGSLSPGLGMNGAAGDYAWYATIPLGIIIWFVLRWGRFGGWISRAAFGGALGALFATFLIAYLKITGYDIFGWYFISMLFGTVAWPLIMHFIHPRQPPSTELPQRAGPAV